MRKPFTRWLSALLAVVLCLSLVPASALAATKPDGSTVTELGTGDWAVTLKNDCEAAVKYSVNLNGTKTEVTLNGRESLTLKGNAGTAYSVTWVEGADNNYVYSNEPSEKTVTGTIGTVTTTYYTYDSDGTVYNGAVSDTISQDGRTVQATKTYAVETLIAFKRIDNVFGWTYQNINDSSETYWAMGDGDARNKLKDHYTELGYANTEHKESESWYYVWVYKTVTAQTETTEGNTEVTFSATAIASGTTGTFKVAALNVDGMPNNVDVASIKQLELNTDGPESEGSERIGAYIEESGIDVLALSESFNFYEEINNNAPSYTTGTQRLTGGIPTKFELTEVLGIKFPFDTDGLNLMYKKGLNVSGESMTSWNEHYSPTTFYGIGSIGIDVPDQNGADGMIDKGYRFYQVQVAEGVVVDVYILHMDADDKENDRAARASQIDQLMTAVEANDNGNPILIMGDTNCRYTRDPLEEKIIKKGFSDPWVEIIRDGDYPDYPSDSIMVTPGNNASYQTGEIVDKVFYKNAEGSNLTIEAVSYDVDADGYTDADGLLGDHPPVIVEFEYTLKSNAVEHTHSWSNEWDSDAGYHWHNCTVAGCDISMNSDKNGYAAHTFTETAIQEPTCTETGSKTLTCSACGYSKTEVIPATGHSYSNDWSYDETNHWHECTVEGCDAISTKEAHTWNNGVVTKEPTCTEAGVKTYTCSVCQATKTESIPTTEHTFATTWTYDETNHWHACTVEGCTATSTPEAHTWNDGVVTTEPTASAAGEKTYTCTVCQATKTETIPATGAYAYTFTVKFGQEHYNVGDTVTANIYLSSSEEGASFTTYEFALNIPDCLKLTSLTCGTGLTGDFTSYTNTGMAGFTSNAAVTLEEPVQIATATFTVAAEDTQDSTTAELTLSDAGATSGLSTNLVNGTVAEDQTTLHNICVTLNPGQATINNQSNVVTLYAKYNQQGLYSDVARTSQATAPTLAANNGYRLATPNQWDNGMANFAAIAAQTFTESKTYTVQTVKTYKVTFQAGNNVTFAEDAEIEVTVDAGTAFSAVSKPNCEVAEHYTFDGWYAEDQKVNDTDLINTDLTVTAKAYASQFDVTMPTGEFEISDLTGVAYDGKATYGQDITFTVTPSSGYAISGVSYTVGENTAATLLNAEDGTYKIDGTAITGDIEVQVSVVRYYTITFTNGTGVEALSATAYAKANDTGLFTDTTFNKPFTIPTPSAAEGYRVAKDNEQEPLWKSGNDGYTSSQLGTTQFSGNTILTAQAVKTYEVTFAAGTHGSFANGAVSELTVDTGTVLTENQIPTVTPAAGYVQNGWSSSVDDLAIDDAITSDVAFTAQYTNATYTLTLPTVTGVTFTVSGATANGNGIYTVTHGTHVTITMTANATTIESVSYKIGDGDSVEVENFGQPLTIDGDSITGAITVNVTATSTYQITVNVEGGHGTVNGKDSDTVTVDAGTTAAILAEKFTFTADPGYVAVVPEFVDVTDDKTYTVTFEDAEYEIIVYWATDEDNEHFASKDPNVDATHDDAVTFTPHVDDETVYAVWYAVGDVDLNEGGVWTELTANENGSYTIPGEAITGKITIFYDTVDGEFTFIEDYMAAPEGEKIAVLDAPKLTSGGYMLGDYGDLFWSDKYGAYVCFVDNGETAVTLAPVLAPTEKNAISIDYSGDINNDGKVSAADTAPIAAVLHNIEVQYTISDLMRFRFDVTGGKKQVTTADIVWILEAYTGKPHTTSAT